MTRLERYLLRRWLTIALPLTLVIAAVLLALTVGDSLRWTRDVPAGQVLHWVVLQVPAILVRVVPVAMLTASAVVIGTLAARHEAPAMRAGGVPVGSVLRPWWVTLTGVALVSLAASEWVVPAAERRAAELWWQITEDRPATFRLRGLDLRLPRSTVLRFEGYDERTDVLLDVRVTRTDGATVEVTRAARAHWQRDGLLLEGGSRVSLDLAALDDALDASTTLSALVAGPETVAALALPEQRSETVARFSGGTYGDGRRLSRQWEVANDQGSSFGMRRWAAFVLHERVAAAVAPMILTLGAVVVGLRAAPSVMMAFAAASSVGFGWFVLVAVGHWLVVSMLVDPWLGAWFGHVVVLALIASAALRR